MPCVRCAERLKKEAMESVGAATTAAMDTVNVGVATVWHNQQQLEAEARALQQQAQRFNKQTAQWLTTFQSFHQSLKALGDVENWARTIEADMAFINSSLEQVQSAREGEQLQLPPPTPAAAASSSSDPPEPFTPVSPREPPAAQ
eukprot:Transcript_23513.p2 GENE.Transcript_23513~~Transcript_23513.p2  ORF type:complete len:145 (-),score=51.19 Transcript_23513:81-515(-)